MATAEAVDCPMKTWANKFCVISESSPEFQAAKAKVKRENEADVAPKRSKAADGLTKVDEVAFACIGFYLNENDLPLDKGSAEFLYGAYIYFFEKIRMSHFFQYDRLRTSYDRKEPKVYRRGDCYKYFRNQLRPYFLEDELRLGILRWFVAMFRDSNVPCSVEYNATWTFKG